MKVAVGLAGLTVALISMVSAASSQELESFSVDKCKDITISAATDPKGIVLHASWCGGPGATRTVNQQIKHFNFGCKKYQFSYGNVYQNELYRLAVLDAKQGRFLEAVERIAACQCHNPPIEQLTRARSRELICWLRVQ